VNRGRTHFDLAETRATGLAAAGAAADSPPPEEAPAGEATVPKPTTDARTATEVVPLPRRMT
jgi:hypothetical protein